MPPKATASVHSSWLQRWAPREGARIRLLCLPPAGASSLHYRALAQTLPSWCEVLAVELPGRGRRSAEAPETDLRVLSDRLAAGLPGQLNGPFAVLGHSLGALFGLELCHALRDRGGPVPSLFIAAGCIAPQLFYGRPRKPDPSDVELLRTLSERDGLPAGVQNRPDFLKKVLEPLRADVVMAETHWPGDHRRPLEAPVRAYWGRQDPGTGAGEVAAWAAEGNGDFQSRDFPGNHFFLSEQSDSLRPALIEDLRATL